MSDTCECNYLVEHIFRPTLQLDLRFWKVQKRAASCPPSAHTQPPCRGKGSGAASPRAVKPGRRGLRRIDKDSYRLRMKQHLDPTPRCRSTITIVVHKDIHTMTYLDPPHGTWPNQRVLVHIFRGTLRLPENAVQQGCSLPRRKQ